MALATDPKNGSLRSPALNCGCPFVALRSPALALQRPNSSPVAVFCFIWRFSILIRTYKIISNIKSHFHEYGKNSLWYQDIANVDRKGGCLWYPSSRVCLFDTWYMKVTCPCTQIGYCLYTSSKASCYCFSRGRPPFSTFSFFSISSIIFVFTEGG